MQYGGVAERDMVCVALASKSKTDAEIQVHYEGEYVFLKDQSKRSLTPFAYYY